MPSSKTALAVEGMHVEMQAVRDGKRKSAPSVSSQDTEEDESTASEDEDGDPLHLKVPRPLEDGEIEGHEGFFTVKEILDETPRKYLIHWEGYAKEEATWEPKGNIVDTALVAAFCKRRAAQAVATILEGPAAIGMIEPEAMVVDDEFIILQSDVDCS